MRTVIARMRLYSELGTRCLKSSAAAAFGKKSSGAAAYRYLNKKVAALPLPLYLQTKQRPLL